MVRIQWCVFESILSGKHVTGCQSRAENADKRHRFAHEFPINTFDLVHGRELALSQDPFFTRYKCVIGNAGMKQLVC